jgi:hypothetical protein
VAVLAAKENIITTITSLGNVMGSIRKYDSSLSWYEFILTEIKIKNKRVASPLSLLKPLHMRYSQYINKQQNITGVLWQGRFFSSPLDEQYTYYGFAYVENNPVFFRSTLFLKLKSLPTLSLSFRIKPSLPHGKPLCVFIFKVLSC